MGPGPDMGPARYGTRTRWIMGPADMGGDPAMGPADGAPDPLFGDAGPAGGDPAMGTDMPPGDPMGEPGPMDGGPGGSGDMAIDMEWPSTSDG